jgi:hypothetical protein
LCRSTDGKRKNKVAEIADLWGRVSEKKEWQTENTLVTSELVESHTPTGSFPVLRNSGWAEVEEVNGEDKLLQFSVLFPSFSMYISHGKTCDIMSDANE